MESKSAIFSLTYSKLLSLFTMAPSCKSKRICTNIL